MKIILNLSKSVNNYEWEDIKELKEFIDKHMLKTLWEFYNKNDLEHDANNLTDDEQNRLYDILDMFTNYEIEGKEEEK